MTKQEWLQTGDPSWLIRRLADQFTQRKLRLFNCACCRRIWDLLVDQECRTAIEVAEKYADKRARGTDLAKVRAAVNLLRAQPQRNYSAIEAVRSASNYKAKKPTCEASITAGHCAWCACSARRSQPAPTSPIVDVYFDNETETKKQTQYEQAECLAQSNLLRDIFGNSFRPVMIDPRWLSATVRDLAEVIYQERAFERMPILGDALLDAGCDSGEIIQHCQGPGPHVRGCWLVDLLTDRA